MDKRQSKYGGGEIVCFFFRPTPRMVCLVALAFFFGTEFIPPTNPNADAIKDAILAPEVQ